MKKLILLFVLITSNLYSQDFKQVTIHGKIVIEGSDIDGITIYNTTSTKGVVTDEKGEFIIPVSLHDVLEVKSLKYNDIDITINKAILKSKKLRVFLIEEITRLDEIIIHSKKLTGNLSEDAKRVKTFDTKLDDIYFGIKNETAYKLADSKIKLTKEPIVKAPDRPIVDGLNIINVVDQLLIPLFRSELKNKKELGIPAVPVKSIKYYLGSNFLIENFNIPEHRVEEFIRYVEDDTFNFNLLNYGHEMEFLELLSKKSKQFLKPKKDKA